MKFPILALSVLLIAANLAAAESPRRKPIAYVGEVIIIGNTITQDRVIRQALVGIQPGQILRPRELKIAERKLAAMGIFHVDPAKNIRPTVQVLNTPGPFKDILVKIEETSTRQWKVESGPNAIGQPVLRLIMVDRNFDPFRFPTSWADIMEGKAFSGGGQRTRIEVMRLSPSQGRLEFFADGSLLPVVVRAWIDDWWFPSPWSPPLRLDPPKVPPLPVCPAK